MLFRSAARDGLQSPSVAVIGRVVALELLAEATRSLRLLAVSPHRRGEHIASALMRPMLDRCDRQRIPAALLCTKQENVPLYQHFGFRVTDTIALTDGPTLWQMLRTPAP